MKSTRGKRLMHDERQRSRTRSLRAEPLAAATSVATGLQIFSPVSAALIYFAGVLSGWMLAKIAFAFFWAKKHARCPQSPVSDQVPFPVDGPAALHGSQTSNCVD